MGRLRGAFLASGRTRNLPRSDSAAASHLRNDTSGASSRRCEGREGRHRRREPSARPGISVCPRIPPSSRSPRRPTCRGNPRRKLVAEKARELSAKVFEYRAGIRHGLDVERAISTRADVLDAARTGWRARVVGALRGPSQSGASPSSPGGLYFLCQIRTTDVRLMHPNLKLSQNGRPIVLFLDRTPLG